MIFLGSRLKELRIRLKLSQEEFGKKVGLSKSAICLYEQGKMTPSKSTLKLICTEYMINQDWIENGDGDIFIKDIPDKELKEAIETIVSAENAPKKAIITKVLKMSDKEIELINGSIEYLINMYKKEC